MRAIPEHLRGELLIYGAIQECPVYLPTTEYADTRDTAYGKCYVLSFLTENMSVFLCCYLHLQKHVAVLLNAQTCCVRILMILCRRIPFLT